MDPTVYLNGRFVSREEARISPDDRGFYFADGVYEVIKYYNGRPFRFAPHLNRLRDGLQALRIGFSGLNELETLCGQLIAINKLTGSDAGVYLQITRGAASRMHRFPGNGVLPTIYINTFQMPAMKEELENGIRVIMREDIRWQRCNIKSIALLPNVLMFQEAAEQGAGECFFVRNGVYTEATHSNIFAVKSGKIYTHPDSHYILPGITKRAVMDICLELDIPVLETPIPANLTGDFDEFFITGTVSEITPVIGIDDQDISGGIPGPITRRLQEEFTKLTHKSGNN
jgi:D-alanine transaminase